MSIIETNLLICTENRKAGSYIEEMLVQTEITTVISL